MADYTLKIGKAVDQDIYIQLDNGDSPAPAFKYDSANSLWTFSHDGSTYITMGLGSPSGYTWQLPGRWGNVRMWDDTDNSVPRWKYGSDPEAIDDGYEFAQFA